MDPEEVISPVSPRKARKRPNRPETWKRNIAKKLSPRLDMCLLCIELKERIKLEKDPEKKQNEIVQRAIHKKRAKAFFDCLKENEPEVLSISFDCQKNLPMPKIPD
ncbi:hypothetical protein J6590_085944 [Homalodisca vitripennis]|nr:hypothetical protein J6590_085944 [Homalodisca vitripennis]